MKQCGALMLRDALCERGWQNTQDLDESQISENMRWGESGSKGLTITIALAEKIYFLQQDFECGVYLPTSSPRPAFVADKKLFAWLWEEPSHILSFSPASAQRWRFPSFSPPRRFFFDFRRRATFLAVVGHLLSFFALTGFSHSCFFNSTFNFWFAWD